MRDDAADRAELARIKPGLVLHADAALNGEPLPAMLDAPITPVSAFFIRNNGTLPDVGDAEGWRLRIDGEVETDRVWSMAALRQSFETVTVTAVLECAGNGRSLFTPATDGVPWGLGAVGCARWTGVRLRDVLLASGVRPSAVYTGHYAPDRQISDPSRPALSRGLPIAKALDPDTLIAFGMNGEPLPLLHGGPLRIVAPGYPGSAWQKWLDRIALRPHEHDGEKMQGTNYRIPLRHVAPGEPISPDGFAVITDMPVKSLVTAPAPGFVAPAGGVIDVGGFAWSGSTPVASVRVSADGGRGWQDAALAPGEGAYAWRRFAVTLPVPSAGPMQIVAQVRDVAGQFQPLDAAPWNPRGYCNNQAQRVDGVAR
ncbi:MAG: sulfite oxidase [Bosea sp. (in: a-proteobacteria)]